MSTIQDSPTAAGSGASASKSFKASLAERGAAHIGRTGRHHRDRGPARHP